MVGGHVACSFWCTFNFIPFSPRKKLGGSTDATLGVIQCSVWPAWWSQAPDWPSGGEIDTFEGVNLVTYNQMSLHTEPVSGPASIRLAEFCTLNANPVFL